MVETKDVATPPSSSSGGPRTRTGTGNRANVSRSARRRARRRNNNNNNNNNNSNNNNSPNSATPSSASASKRRRRRRNKQMQQQQARLRLAFDDDDDGYYASGHSQFEQRQQQQGAHGKVSLQRHRQHRQAQRHHRPDRDLEGLVEMFSAYDREVVEDVYRSLNCSSDAAVEFFLSDRAPPIPQVAAPELRRTHSPLQTLASFRQFASPVGDADAVAVSRIGGKSTDPLFALPADALMVMCEFLDVHQLAALARVSRGCYGVVCDAFQRVRYANCSRYRHWSDQRILSMLSKFPRVEHVNMRKCRDFESFEQLASAVPAKGLRSLNLHSCSSLTDRAFHHLVAFTPDVESLDLGQTYVSDTALAHLGEHMSQLQRVSLSRCTLIGDKGVKRMLRSLKRLEDVNLEGTYVTDELLVSKTDTYASVTSLSLRACEEMGRSIVVGGAVNNPFPALVDLNLSFNKHLRHVTIGPTCRQLATLNLSKCRDLRTLRIRGTPYLKTLNLSGCANLETIEVVGVTHLETINAFQCRKLTATSIMSLVRSCVSLQQSAAMRRAVDQDRQSSTPEAQESSEAERQQQQQRQQQLNGARSLASFMTMPHKTENQDHEEEDDEQLRAAIAASIAETQQRQQQRQRQQRLGDQENVVESKEAAVAEEEEAAAEEALPRHVVVSLSRSPSIQEQQRAEDDESFDPSTTLRTVRVCGCMMLPDQAVFDTMALNENLVVFDIGGCKQLDVSTHRLVAARMKENKRRLRVADGDDHGDDAIASLSLSLSLSSSETDETDTDASSAINITVGARHAPQWLRRQAEDALPLY